jgi:hypothetical protein
MAKTFTLTDKHIKLLMHANVGWNNIETGAPEINGKRPYGNSDVAQDVIKLLFGEIPQDAMEALEDYAMQLHSETETALQIILCTGQFKPGKYYQSEEYVYSSWKLQP